MSHFAYRNGVLHAETVPLTAIAAAVGTPAYVYSTAAIGDAYTGFAAALAGLDATICYALKANDNLAVVRTLADLGAGADVVSEGELRRALAAGVPPTRIVFAGVGKTRAEMAAALDAGILQFNVESAPELEALSKVASARGRTAHIALRVNPDVDARTHAKITTGKRENKFGVPLAHARDLYAQAAKLPGIEPDAIAVHIGSQLTELTPFAEAFACVAELTHALRADGLTIDRLDLGGGLGIAYDGGTPPDAMAYARIVRDTVGELDCALVFEPGRMLVGQAGVLLSRVVYVKPGDGRDFLVVDAAMNDLVRPAMYDGWHDIRPVREAAANAAIEPVDVVGPVCESGDTFARDRALPPIAADELLVFDSAGAYGAVMASTYNARPTPPELLVRGGDFAVVRARESYDAMLERDVLPAWLAPETSDRTRGAA